MTVKHKRGIYGGYINDEYPLCGYIAKRFIPILRTQWRWVTCKRCLKYFGKDGG